MCSALRMLTYALEGAGEAGETGKKGRGSKELESIADAGCSTLFYPLPPSLAPAPASASHLTPSCIRSSLASPFLVCKRTQSRVRVSSEPFASLPLLIKD